MVADTQKFVRYWDPRKGGWHIGILEGEVRGKAMLKIRPLKPKTLCIEVPACDVEATDIRKASEVLK